MAADDDRVRRAARLAAPLAMAAAALVAVPPGPAAAAGPVAPPPPSGGRAAHDLPALQQQLGAATEQAQQLAEALEAAAARHSALRVEMDRLSERQDVARHRVDVRARQAYLAAASVGTGPLGDLVVGLAAADLRGAAQAEVARRGAAGAVRAAVDLADAVGEHSEAARVLQEQAAVFRAGLQEQAALALQAQEQARRLLVRAEAALAAEQARTRAAAAARAQAAELARTAAAVAASRGALDSASAAVTSALTPAQTRRSRAAAAREAPVVAVVEAAGSGYPAGYAPTGTVLRGLASWYGPGFVGRPTASGAPYDPERLTCAHKSLPLGTVVRVSRAGLAVSCLVNDRGPYVGDRIIDLSRAGSRALGFDGVAAVAVEVLARQP